MLLEKKQNIHTHKKPHEEFEAVNILCFFGKGCRWGFTFHRWGQQPAPHPPPPRLARGGHLLREKDALREKTKNKELLKLYN